MKDDKSNTAVVKDTVKKHEFVVTSTVVSLRLEKAWLQRFDDIIGYFAYNRNEAIKEGMRKLIDDLTKRKLKIDGLKKKVN
jgi:metal-responsive CopG/Arc/MetJ family transcriptional regulator